MPLKSNRQSVFTAVIYVCVAGLWILLSDVLIAWAVPDLALRTQLAIVKGGTFVLATGVLLYLVLRRTLRRVEREMRRREVVEAERAHSLEQLRRSEERFRLAFAGSADGFWDWDLVSGSTQLSSSYWEMTGYPANTEPVTLDFLKRIVHPDDWPNVAAAMKEHLAGKSAQSVVEYRLLTKDGTIKWIWGRGKVVERGPDGQALRMVGTFTDITTRKQVNAELMRARAHYKTLLEVSSDGIHILDAAGNLLEANATFYRMLGYSPLDPPRLNVADWDAQWTAPELRAKMQEAMGCPGLFETVFRCQNGHLTTVEVNAQRIEIDGQACLYASARDITERRRAESALRESEEKFSKIFQMSPVPMSLSTLSDGRFVDLNEEFARLVGRPRESILDHTSLELGIWENPPDRAVVAERIRECGLVRDFEVTICTAGGERRRVLWSGEPMVIGGANCLLVASLDITERKLAEQKIKESEERYRQLFELESDAVILVDCETHRVMDVNQSAQRLYGFSRDEFLQKAIEEVSDEPELTRARVGRGPGFTPLRWHRKKDGSRFAVEISSNIISHLGRRTELSTLRDITNRQHVMEMLSETTEQLLEAQRIAGLGSYVFDTATGRWTGSDVLGEILGFAEPGLARDFSAWSDLVHPEDRPGLLTYWQEEVFKKRQPFDRTYRIIRVSDGQERWVHGLGKVVLDGEGRVTRLVGVIQDITERKRDQEKMNLQFSALAATANAIVITDRAGIIEWVNPAFSRLTGYCESEAVGCNPHVLKSGEQPPAFYADLWTTILTGNAWHGELVNRRKDGQCYRESMTITPVRAADGKIAHFVAVKQDVTEQRQLEMRMQQAQKMEAIGTLAGGIAHDFNNILAAMYGYAYLLKQDTEGNPGAQENVEELLKATGRAKDLVQQILTFSRQREQKPHVIRLETIIKEAVKFLRASLPSQIKIEINTDPAVPAVLADPTQIYQVAINLATNALHAMEGRTGKLTVSLENFVPDAKFLQSHPEFHAGRYACLKVADTGHGMDAKTMERIFEPFFTTKPPGKGTGLGLSVVHGIVQAHNGVVTVQSNVGQGTTFFLYFPGQTQDAATPGPVESETPCGAGQRILVLDDEPSLTDALQRLLRRLDYKVIASNNPREALDWCRRNPDAVDLVITDLTMPEMTGLEVARQLRELRPDLPVLLASGFSAELSEEMVADSGVCQLVPKPVSRHDLAQAVQSALARTRPPAPVANGVAY